MKKKKIQRNRSSVLHVPLPVFLFAATSNTSSTRNTSMKPLHRGKNTVDRGNEKHDEAEERRRRINVCHYNWLPRQQCHREPPTS
jgi:hypothetical protein